MPKVATMMSAARIRLRRDRNSHTADSSTTVVAGQRAATRATKPKGISDGGGSGAWRARRTRLSQAS